VGGGVLCVVCRVLYYTKYIIIIMIINPLVSCVCAYRHASVRSTTRGGGERDKGEGGLRKEGDFRHDRIATRREKRGGAVVAIIAGVPSCSSTHDQ
jgi:hypothetical protein